MDRQIGTVASLFGSIAAVSVVLSIWGIASAPAIDRAPISQSGVSQQVTLLIPDQAAFMSEESIKGARAFLAKTWGVSEDRIFVIVRDSEPWMTIIGLLDVRTLSSARLYILDTSQPEGRRWESLLAAQGAAHRGNLYVIHEFKPADPEREVVRRFYSTETLGGLAIIEEIRWTNFSNRSGNIIAYRSEKFLPSIEIPIESGIPRKGKTYQTPVE